MVVLFSGEVLGLDRSPALRLGGGVGNLLRGKRSMVGLAMNRPSCIRPVRSDCSTVGTVYSRFARCAGSSNVVSLERDVYTGLLGRGGLTCAPSRVMISTNKGRTLFGTFFILLGNKRRMLVPAPT